MTWLRVGDTFAYHPTVLAVMEEPETDERSVDEVCGYMTRLATLAAQHKTDYVVTMATAIQLAGSRPRAERLLSLAGAAGYGDFEVEVETGRFRFRFIADIEFIHMKSAEQIAFEAQRRNDNANAEIVVPVRHRDGDACRYCGRVVNWDDRKGAYGGTYDHRPPGEAASAETSVVACRSCNSQRGAIQRTFGGLRGAALLDAIDDVVPLLPVPWQPYYHPATRELFRRNPGVLAELGLLVPPGRPGRPLAHGRLAPGSHDPAALPVTDISETPDKPLGNPGRNPTGNPRFNRGIDPETPEETPDYTTASDPKDDGYAPRNPAETAPAASTASVRPPVTADRWGADRDGSGRVGTGLDRTTRARAAQRRRSRSGHAGAARRRGMETG